MSTWTTNPAGMPNFLTPEEVSDLLRVSVYSVRRWIKAGELPAYKVGRMWRIDKAELDAWLAQCKLTDLDNSN
jgi:excisionase family DNA binding protein